MLKEQQVEKYRRLLEEEKKKLIQGVEDEEATPDFGGDVDAFDEETDEAEETENRLAVGETMRDRMSQIDEALEKIENGTYGLCEECGNEIEEKVLQVAPESILCAECKKGHS